MPSLFLVLLTVSGVTGFSIVPRSISPRALFSRSVWRGRNEASSIALARIDDGTGSESLTSEALMKLKKVELTEMCRVKKLPVTGTKTDLTARLIGATQVLPLSVQNIKKVLPDAPLNQPVNNVAVTSEATFGNKMEALETQTCELRAELAEAIAQKAFLQDTLLKLELQNNETRAFADKTQKELQDTLAATATATLAADKQRSNLEREIQRLRTEILSLKEAVKAAEDTQIETDTMSDELRMLQTKVDELQVELDAESKARSEAEAIANQAVREAGNVATSVENKSLLEASALALEHAEAKIASLVEGRSAKEAQVSAKAEQVANLCLTLQDKIQHMQAELTVESAAREKAESNVAELESQLTAERDETSKVSQATSTANSAQENLVAEKAEKVAALCMKLQADVHRLRAELAIESEARLEAEAIAVAATAEATASKALAEQEIAAAEDTFKALADRTAEKASRALKTAEEIPNDKLSIAPTESNTGSVTAGLQSAIEAAKENADRINEAISAFSKDPSKSKWLSFGKKKTEVGLSDEAEDGRA